jgi:hypothetical protein
MKTHSEWVAYFRDLGMDNGMIWHMMDGMYALRMVRRERYDRHVADYWYERRKALCRT